MNENTARLRPHPADRFAGESHFFDLGAALKDLRAEAHAGDSGHRQVTIFHRAPVTQVLFSFETGSQLTEHSARGLVAIHALEGRLTVATSSATYDLLPGQIVVLESGVPHSVSAVEPSAMLLTVNLGAGS